MDCDSLAMPCLASKIIVTDLSIISPPVSPCKGRGDVSVYKSTSIHTTALFWDQVEGGYISITFVEKAFGSKVPRGRSGIYPTAQLTWRLAIFDQGSETSYLRVVSELDHDVVFGRGVGCGSLRAPPVNQQHQPCNSSNHPSGFQKGWLGITAVVEYLVRLEDSELEKKLADSSFVKSFASSCGIGLEGEQSVKACASLIRRRIETLKHGRRPASHNPTPPTRSTTLDTRLRSEETETSVSSGFDKGDQEYECSTTSSEPTWERNLPQPPSFVRGTGHTRTENVTNPSTEAAQVLRGSSPGASTETWTFVKSSSPQPMTDDASPPPLADRAELVELVELSPGQDQMSDFDMHPGHKVWVWDKDRQRWRRRGRSGLEETDWFPESFA
ncbi:hypothetical protein CEP51_013360 [Fusarium floridanum]|uniref:Uncharacterized protein n=1 Tax=Fusarium floridanum TaxID=1325733 RepID=A0A428QCY2_9HYPO|nr:hypothetical protein CEP51_013360 [Fusarium floridanum]